MSCRYKGYDHTSGRAFDNAYINDNIIHREKCVNAMLRRPFCCFSNMMIEIYQRISDIMALTLTDVPDRVNTMLIVPSFKLIF